MEKQRWFLRFLRPLLNERGQVGDVAEATRDEVSVIVNDGLSPEKIDQTDDGGVTDVDDLLEKGDKEDPLEKDTEKTPKEKEPVKPADKGETKVEDDIKALREELEGFKKDKKNLQIALHKARQEKKGTPKEEATTLTDAQLVNIIKENPDDPEVLMRVTRYMAEKIAGGMKDTAISEVDVSQKSKAINNALLERYPALAEESSEMRIEIDQVKESLGLKGNPFGDAFAVGLKVVENLPTLLTNAYERGKKEALGVAAEKKRGENIEDSQLTPKGKGKSSAASAGLSKEHEGTAKQLNLSPSAKKIYAQLVGKNPKTLSVEE